MPRSHASLRPDHLVQADWSETPIALRMARVMRRQLELGQPTTEDDFLEAEETCDVSRAELHAQIGAAKRLIAQGADLAEIETTQQRVTRALRLIGGLIPDDTALFEQLRQGGFSSIEIGALWPHLMLALGRKIAARQKPKVQVA